MVVKLQPVRTKMNHFVSHKSGLFWFSSFFLHHSKLVSMSSEQEGDVGHMKGIGKIKRAIIMKILRNKPKKRLARVQNRLHQNSNWFTSQSWAYQAGPWARQARTLLNKQAIINQLITRLPWAVPHQIGLFLDAYASLQSVSHVL